MKKVSIGCAFLILTLGACNKKSGEPVVEAKPTPYRFESLKPKESHFQIFTLLSRNPDNSIFLPTSFKSGVSSFFSELSNEKKLKFSESFGEATPEVKSESYSIKNSWWFNTTKNSKSSLKEINSWLTKNSCDQKTKSLTPEYLKKFKNLGISKFCVEMAWENQFDEKDTILAHFQSSPHAASTVSMMMKKGVYRYFEDEHSQWVELTALKSPLTLLVALPKKKFNIQQTSMALNTDYFNKIDAGLSSEKVELVIPKFSLNHDISYKEILSLIGNDYFFDRKNYIKNSNFNKNKIDDLIQMFDFRIDEFGINQAKTDKTVTMTNDGIRIGFTKKFYADQPFLVVLKDQKTSEILFISQVIKIK